MITGLVLALIAGSLVGIQNVFNSKVNEGVGTWTTTAIVLAMGFIASFSIGLAVEGKQLFDLSNMKTWYWFSGIIGVGVVLSVVQGVKQLGPTYAISIVMASQIGFALLFDSLGLLGLDKVPFTGKQAIGVLVIVGGIIVFKTGGRRRDTRKSVQSQRTA
ncbi:DMT family transporter [Paenibacillus lutimineralis]|uniref:DMT family transporter n=1 Tax=Paenibacillus lutimineralis TaxID=2707005 RepID=A0A3Q9IA79_9BACL|nr:DMT family transporter [Paenibacillus lutimineralis]AZS16218.1 DMT family transporter [Paenibacillus lutimineralis]